MKLVLFILTGSLFLHPFPASAQSAALSLARASLRNFSGQSNTISEKELQNCCSRLQKDHRRIYYLISRGFRMNLQLKGIYSHEKLLFFRLTLSNHSHLDYDVDSIRFVMRDRWPLKKKVMTVSSLPSVYTYGNTRLIRGKTREESVVVLPQFTLPAEKRLVIEVTEKNGGRKLQL